jgi:hypothetical protein
MLPLFDLAPGCVPFGQGVIVLGLVSAAEDRDDIPPRLASGLDAFAEQFRAQAKSAGLPGSEHAIHFCLALGLQAAWALSPGDIVFERPSRNRSRADLWVREPHDMVIEVKYLRSVLSGSQPARPCTTASSWPTSTSSRRCRAGSG